MLVAREVKGGLVLLMAVLAYVVGYGWAVMLSVQILLHGYGPPEGSGSGSGSSSDGVLFAGEATLLAVALLLAGGAAWSLGRRPALLEWLIGRRHRVPGRGLLVAGVLLLLDLAGFWLFVWINPSQPAQDPATHALWYDIARGIWLGAIGEEFVVLALPVMVVRWLAPQLLQRARPAAGLVALLVIARIAYHLYQGAWAWSHLPWAVGAVLLYLWTGRVWPQILAHAFYDTTLALSDHHEISQPAEMVLLHGVATVVVILGLVMMARGRRRPAISARPAGAELTPMS